MSRRFQFDLGTLFWLIAVFCACLVGIPAMLDKLWQFSGPECTVIDREPARELQSIDTEDQR